MRRSAARSGIAPGTALPAPAAVFPRYVETEAKRTGVTMLVDSHCHLDFPDFAGELDAIVGRARDAGVGRMVTISTQVKKHGDLLAIAERFPDVLLLGRHPSAQRA